MRQTLAQSLEELKVDYYIIYNGLSLHLLRPAATAGLPLSITNHSEVEQNQILCEELAMLIELLPPDTEILQEPAAYNSIAASGLEPTGGSEATN